MKILLTNDDGIHAAGLEALYDELRKKHTVFVFAPDGERSACSNALTIGRTIRVDRLDDFRYSVHGYPADCVNVGLHSSFVGKIDLVVSGINHGPNLADDIYYSGTVAGARTAFIFGINGIAVSLNSYTEHGYFPDCAAFTSKFIEESGLFGENGPSFININYPPVTSGKIRGVHYSHLGKRYYVDEYKIEKEEGDSIYMRLDGTISSEERDDSDVTEIEKGYITVTPLTLDTTDYPLLQRFRAEV